MLDTTPYNGILTMRDCLYVGTPVVCKPGHQRSAVEAVIPAEYLVDNEEQYIERAVKAVNDDFKD
jgi:predicted O-linked N-acetylglucosamine transferase (SPINDLY family)